MFIQTPIDGLLIYKPQIFRDERGFFAESYNTKKFADIGITTQWVQDNYSVSKKNVLRGLHFQTPPFEQAKFVSVVKGRAFDVAVDLRPSSKTFGHWFGIELSDQDMQYVYIPRGFAHGFVSLAEETHFHYKVDNFYNPKADSGIFYADSEIAIKWPVKTEDILLSAKDHPLQLFMDFKRSL